MFEPCGIESCGGCYRVDSDMWDDHQIMYTYVGEYAIITEVASEHRNILFQILGIGENCPKYTTTVIYVGEYSVVESAAYISDVDCYRFVQRHDDEGNVRGVHDMVVNGIRTNLIDVSRPLTDDEYEEQMAY